MCPEINITVLYISTVSYSTSQYYSVHCLEWIDNDDVVIGFFEFKEKMPVV